MTVTGGTATVAGMAANEDDNNGNGTITAFSRYVYPHAPDRNLLIQRREVWMSAAPMDPLP